MQIGDMLIGLALALGSGRLSACALVPGPPGPESSRSQGQALEQVTFDSGTRRIAALHGGEPGARRMIFVHGSPGDAETWLDYLIAPPGKAETIAFDRPGFGNSRPLAVQTRLIDQASVLEPLLVARDGRWPILVGHSLGGPIALRAAADYPERVGGVVVIAGAVDPGLERLRWYNYLAKGLAWIIPGPLRRSNDEMWGLSSELQQLEVALANVRCPVWILHGTNDNLVPVANVDFLQRSLADTRTTVMEGAGHFLIWQDEWVPTVRAVLRLALQAPRD